MGLRIQRFRVLKSGFRGLCWFPFAKAGFACSLESDRAGVHLNITTVFGAMSCR